MSVVEPAVINMLVAQAVDASKREWAVPTLFFPVYPPTRSVGQDLIAYKLTRVLIAVINPE